MVSVRRAARRWRSYLAGGGLVLTLCAAVPLNGPPPGGGDTETQHQAATASEHQNTQPAESYAEQPLSADNQQSGGENGVAPQAERKRRWYAEPDWWVAGFTGLLVLATTGLWVFTALLWIATRRAVTDSVVAIVHAEAAAKAATRQAELSEQALFSNNRPYLLVRPHKAFLFTERNENNSFYRFEYDYVNGGPSTAIVKETWSSAAIIEGNPMESLYAGMYIETHYLFIGPEDSHQFSGVHITDMNRTIREAIISKERNLIVFGGVTYESLMNREHETRFCWRYDPDTNQFHEDRTCKAMNRRT